MPIRERRVVTFFGTGIKRVQGGTLYAKRDDPFDIRFESDLSASDEYDRLGEVYARPGGILVVGKAGFQLSVGGGEYSALAVAMGVELACLVATNEAEAHALAKVTEAHAEMRRREREG